MADYGVIKAWGDNGYDQQNITPPNSNYASISCGGFHALALNIDGALYCWGRNNYNQATVPSPNSGFNAVSGGYYHSLGLRSSGVVVAWGLNDFNQTDVPSPNTDFVSISAGGFHSLGLKSDGTAVAWGRNTYGQATIPSPNSDFTSVVAGDNFSLGLKSGGTAVGWGLNADGQTTIPSPNSDFVMLAAGAGHSLGLKSTGEIVSWGDDTYNQVTDSPIGTDYTFVAASYHHSLAIKSDGSIIGWGLDTDAVIGSISTDVPFSLLSTGYAFAAAVSIPQILLFTGSYNNGTNSGTVNLSERVMNIGIISEVLVSTNTRPWCQETSVVLDDSDSYFIGTLAKGTQWYDGTFNIWAQHGTAWEQLLTGYVPTADWSYDYGQKLATINVTSMLAKSAALSMGYGGSVYPSSSVDTNREAIAFFHNGTITAIGTDGTVSVEYYNATGAPVPWKINAYCWTEFGTAGTVDQEIQAPARISSVGSWSGTTVGTTFTTKYLSDITFEGGTKDWMTVGNSIVVTEPWPSPLNYPTVSLSAIDLFDTAIGSAGLSWDATSKTKFESDLLIIPIAMSLTSGTEVLAGPFMSNGAAPLYFGGQMWVEALNDLMTSVGANWTVDGLGKVRAKIKRASALESVVGTIDFADAEQELTANWTFNETEGLSVISVYHEWNSVDQEYRGTAQVESDSNIGITLKQEAKWQRDLGGKLLANRIMTWEEPISRVFPLSFPKEDWGSCIPGSLINLINVPTVIAPLVGTGAAPLIASGKYTIQARHYDYMNERMIADLRQSPPLTGVFILDYSELDGSDKLY